MKQSQIEVELGPVKAKYKVSKWVKYAFLLVGFLLLYEKFAGDVNRWWNFHPDAAEIASRKEKKREANVKAAPDEKAKASKDESELILQIKGDDFGALATSGLASISLGNIENASDELEILEKQYERFRSRISSIFGWMVSFVVRDFRNPTSLELADFHALRGAVAEWNLKLDLNRGLNESDEKRRFEKVLSAYEEAVKLAPRNEAFIDMRDQFLNFTAERQAETHY
jgi:hypothetical protein